jgi:hypothetical protein
MSFSEHIDVTVGKVSAMLGFVERLPGEFRYALSLALQVMYGGLFMTCMSIGLSACAEKAR